MQLIKNLSIRYKLIVIILFTSVVALGIGFSAVFYHDIKTFREETVNSTRMTARLMGEHCATSLEFQYKSGVDEVLEKLESLPSITVGIVYDEEGKIFSQYFKNSAAGELLPLLGDSSGSQFTTNHLHVYQPIMVAEQRIGTIYLKASTLAFKIKIRKFKFMMFSLTIGILIFTYFLTLKLQSFVSTPILKLADVTNKISQENDYSLRVTKQSNDEIGTLYQGFNKMLEQIQLRADERDRATRALEEKTVALTRALSELKSTQAQLFQAEKMAVIGNLVAGVTHEINNPIGAVKCAADNSRRSLKKIEQILTQRGCGEVLKTSAYQALIEIFQNNTDVILSASERIAKISKSLRNFARLDEAELQLIDLREGIDNTLILLNHEIGDRVKIIKQLNEIPSIPCYASQLNQVFMTLLLYSAQTIENQGEITISTQTVSRNDNPNAQLEIRISDTGRGHSSGQIANFFDLSFTTKNSRVQLGLELSNVYNIIKKHQGEITVQSEPGNGTLFIITLPANQKFHLSQKNGLVSKAIE